MDGLYGVRVAAVALALASTLGHAAVIDEGPSDYRQKIATLAPGDTLRLASGTYTH